MRTQKLSFTTQNNLDCHDRNLWKLLFFCKASQSANRVSSDKYHVERRRRPGPILCRVCWHFYTLWQRHTHLGNCCSVSILPTSQGLAGNCQCDTSWAAHLVHSRRLLFCIMVPCLKQSVNSQKDGFLPHWVSDVKLTQHYCRHYCLRKLIFHQSENCGENRF